MKHRGSLLYASATHDRFVHAANEYSHFMPSVKMRAALPDPTKNGGDNTFTKGLVFL